MLSGVGAVRYLLLPLVGLLAAWAVARFAGRAGWPGAGRSGLRPRVWLAVLGLMGALTFGGLVTARYLTWHSFVHDLGSYDQKVWLVSVQGSSWAMLEQTWRGGEQPSFCPFGRGAIGALGCDGNLTAPAAPTPQTPEPSAS